MGISVERLTSSAPRMTPIQQPTSSSSSILKRRMQLKRIEIQIEKAVVWTLGYCPSDIWFDELLDKRNDLSLIVSKTDPEWWAIYDRFRAADNCKRLMIFLPTNVERRQPEGETNL